MTQAQANSKQDTKGTDNTQDTHDRDAAGTLLPLPQDLSAAHQRRRVEQHLPLVEEVAKRMLAKLPPRLQLEDVVASGTEGLLDAAAKYDPTEGASFATYAKIRIRGAIVDSLRRRDTHSRTRRRKATTLRQAREAAEQRLQRPADQEDVAQELGVSTTQVAEMEAQTREVQLVGGEALDHVAEGPGATPFRDQESALVATQARQLLGQALGRLPEREAELLRLYYFEERTMAEVGEALGVGEARVCQLHGRAVARLRGSVGRLLTPTESRAAREGKLQLVA